MRKRPDDYNSWEYLKEHLYDLAWQGGFSEEFSSLKAVLPQLMSYEHLVDLLKALSRAGGRRLSGEVIRDLVRVYQTRFDLRPASGLVLMLVLWDDLTESYGKGDGFANSYWDLFQTLETEHAVSLGGRARCLLARCTTRRSQTG